MKSNTTYDVIIVGGGLAGLTSALHLSKSNKRILVIEKNDFPKHKVCGEYISNEVLPYLNSLGINPIQEGAKQISKVELTTVKSNLISGKLPLGGFGMSRYYLDNLLCSNAKSNGAAVLKDTVTQMSYHENQFAVETKSGEIFRSNVVIGAFGKRSNLDMQMNRKFIHKKSPYLAVKTHVKGEFPEELVALHNILP